MKKKIITSVVLLALILSGCRQANKKIELDTIKVSSQKEHAFSLDSIISRIEIIPLETSEDVIFKNISKVICFENKYFIKDTYEGVFVFSNEGRFLYRIGKKGRGPGEYGNIADFGINKYTRNVEILSVIGRMNVYSLLGEYKYSYVVNCHTISNFINLSEDLILCYHQDQSPILSLYSREKADTINSFIGTPDDFHRRRPIGLNSSSFFITKSDTLFHFPYSNIIHSIEKLKIKRYTSLDFGSKNFNINDYIWDLDTDKSYYRENIWKEGNYAFGFHNLFETERYLIEQYYINSDLKQLIIDKKRNKYYISTVYENLYDMTYGVNTKAMWNKLSTATNSGTRIKMVLNWDSQSDFLITSADPIEYKRYINEGLLDTKTKNILERIKPDQNPFLIKYYFRN